MADRYPVVEPSKIDDELIISSLETLKVVADPLRKRILELFDKPNTVKAIARQLGTTPSKLYYHVNLLEEHGLLRVTDTRIVSGIIEKQYQCAARVIRVKAGLLSPTPEEGDEGLNVMLANLLDYTRDQLRTSVREGIVDLSEDADKHRSLFMSQLDITLTSEVATQFYARLRELVDEFSQVAEVDDDTPGAQNYLLQIAMFPTRDAMAGDEALGLEE